MYLKAGSGDAPGADTIFKVTRNGSSDAVFLINKVSTVHVGEGGLYDFQNAPHFMSFVPTQQRRDAEYETEAVLKHYPPEHRALPRRDPTPRSPTLRLATSRRLQTHLQPAHMLPRLA